MISISAKKMNNNRRTSDEQGSINNPKNSANHNRSFLSFVLCEQYTFFFFELFELGRTRTKGRETEDENRR